MTLIKWNWSHPGMVLGFQDLGSNSISTLSSFWSLPVRYNQLVFWMFSENGCTFIQIISRIKFFLLWYVICCSVAQSCLTLCDPMDYSTPGSSPPLSPSLLKLVPIESMMPSNHLILCCPLLLLPSSFPNIRVFSNESALRIKWPKYWSLSISPSDEYSRLISFMIDWFDLLAVQGTLKSLLQHHSLKASTPQHSAFFMIQLLHLYMTTGKTIGLTMVFDYCLSFLICCLVLS